MNPRLSEVNCKHHLNLMIRRKIYLKNHLTTNVDRMTLQQYIELIYSKNKQRISFVVLQVLHVKEIEEIILYTVCDLIVLKSVCTVI